MPSSAADQYFVDEAGDLTLFDSHGRVVVGNEGVSRTFIVGAALLDDPEGAATRLNDLRRTLLADPLYAAAPSMQPASRKTALAFHAKDDLPEVRMQVFQLLRTESIRVFAAFRRKDYLARDFRAHFKRTGWKRDVEGVYEELLLPIFSPRLHLATENRIVFAKRGKADRSKALQAAIELAKSRFERKWQKGIDRPTSIHSAAPNEHAGLQAVDYFLWALQRLLERSDRRFFEGLRGHFRLIVDVDDRRRSSAGEYYADRNPLSLERLMPVTKARPE